MVQYRVSMKSLFELSNFHFIKQFLLNRCILIFLVVLTSCQYNVEIEKAYQQYFDEATYQNFKKGIELYQTGQYQLADSLFTLVIKKSQEKITLSTPTYLNPFYYRAQNSIEIDKYRQAIDDFKRVVSDTTTNTDILLSQTEAYRMLHQYDSSIQICNHLLSLQVDSSIILEQRGLCFYQAGNIENACSDFSLSKKMAKENTPLIDSLLKKCK